MDDELKGYIAGQSIAGGVVGEMRRQRLDYERRSTHETKANVLSAEVAKFMLANDVEGAFEYLNERFMEEIVDDCQNQEDRNFSLETILRKRKDKYAVFYERIGKEMPEKLSALTADELCLMLGVKNLHVKDNNDDTEPVIPFKSKTDVNVNGCGWTVAIILLVGVILAFVISVA